MFINLHAPKAWVRPDPNLLKRRRQALPDPHVKNVGRSRKPGPSRTLTYIKAEGRPCQTPMHFSYNQT